MAHIKAVTVNLVILAIFFVLVLLLLNVDSWLGLKDYRSLPAFLVGWFLVISGLVLRLWAFSAAQKNLAGDNKYGGDGANSPAVNHVEPLVIEGPYARTRNPLELGVILIASGLAATLGSYIGFVLPISVFFVLDAWIRSKEKDMEIAFGSRFLEYKNSVPRWWGSKK